MFMKIGCQAWVNVGINSVYKGVGSLVSVGESLYSDHLLGGTT